MTITEPQPNAGAIPTAEEGVHDATDTLSGLFDSAALVVDVPEGDPVCREGDASDTWWYVLEGEADVTRSGRLVGMVGPGETIGETSVLDGRPRSATVVARSPLRLRVGVGSELRTRCQEQPAAAFALSRLLAERLRDVDELHAPGQPVAATTATETFTAVEPAEQLVFDPTAPGYFDDPSSQLDALREAAALIPRPDVDGWMVTRYDDVQRLARDRRLGNSTDPARPSPVIDAERAALEANPMAALSMLRRDGDDHHRLRRLVSSAFTPKAIARWRERARAISDELLDGLERNGGGDLINDYALPLPVRVISDMLGFDTDDAEQMREWSHRIALTLDGNISQEDRDRGSEAMRAMLGRIAERYEEERVDPGDGILAALVHAEEDGERLSREEVLMNTALLYVAGHETTTNLIGNGTVQLLRHPEQLYRLRVDPSLDSNLVEEVLRYDSPVQFNRRIAVDDVEVAGTTIEAGTVLLLCATSANRDPRHWGPSAGEFRVDRKGANGQVSFGGGPHHCLGAALARLEGAIALPALVRRFPDLHWTREPSYEPRVVLRGLGSLPIEI